jgi:hypothetical protein
VTDDPRAIDPGAIDPDERRLPMFPLSTVLLPGEVIPLHIFEVRYRQLTEHCLAGDGNFGVVLIARGAEVGGGEQRSDIGPIAHIEDSMRFDDGRYAGQCAYAFVAGSPTRPTHSRLSFRRARPANPLRRASPTRSV